MPISREQRKRLNDRADRFCEVQLRGCLQMANNAHHRKNQSQGGNDDLSNLVLACGSGTTGCHGWITEHPREARANGWTVWSGDEPAEVPVMYRGMWARLDNEGHVHLLRKGEVRNDLGHLSIANK